MTGNLIDPEFGIVSQSYVFQSV